MLHTNLLRYLCNTDGSQLLVFFSFLLAHIVLREYRSDLSRIYRSLKASQVFFGWLNTIYVRFFLWINCQRRLWIVACLLTFDWKILWLIMMKSLLSLRTTSFDFVFILFASAHYNNNLQRQNKSLGKRLYSKQIANNLWMWRFDDVYRFMLRKEEPSTIFSYANSKFANFLHIHRSDVFFAHWKESRYRKGEFTWKIISNLYHDNITGRFMFAHTRKLWNVCVSVFDRVIPARSSP